jgi:hypothetical protein
MKIRPEAKSVDRRPGRKRSCRRLMRKSPIRREKAIPHLLEPRALK